MADLITNGTHSVSTGWHHVTYVKSGNDHRLYLDAVEDVTVLTYPMFTLVPTCLMLYFDGGPGGLPPGPRMAAIKMWTAALTPAEITVEMAGYGQVRTANRYNESHLSAAEALVDSSGLGHDFAIDPSEPGDSPTPLITEADGPNGAMVSSVGLTNDGAGDGVAISILSNLPTTIGAGDFTAMVWVRAQDNNGETFIFRFANDDNLGGTPQVSINLRTDRLLSLVLNNYLQTLTLGGGVSPAGSVANPAEKTKVSTGTVAFVADAFPVIMPPRYSVQQEFNVTIAGRQKLRLPSISIANTSAHHTVRSQQIIDALAGNISTDLLSDDPSIGDVPISVMWANTANYAFVSVFANTASFWRGISEFQAGTNIVFTPNAQAIVISAASVVNVEHANTANTANSAAYLNGVSAWVAGAGLTFTPVGTTLSVSVGDASGTANGIVSNVTQSFGGAKTFLGALTANAGLTVNGTVQFNNTISANGSVGSAGWVLTSAGAGANAYWVASSAGVTNSYGHVGVSGQANLVAAGANSVLTVVAGNGVVLTTNVTSDGALHVAVNGAQAIGNTTITGFANITSTLQVAGLSTLTGNATLSGFANIAQTLNVAGVSNFTGNATFGGFVNAAGKLVVAGNAAITGNLTQTGNATFSGFVNVATTLNVAGISQMTGNTTHSGFVNITTTLQVTGLTTLTGNATLSGFANIATTLQVTGNTQAGNVNVTGFLNVSTTLNVAGNTTLVGNVTITANTIGNGRITANAGLTVNGTVVFANTLSANGGVGTALWVLTSGGAGANAYWAEVSSPASTTNSFGLIGASGVANLVALTGNSLLTFVAGNGILFTSNVGSDGAFHIAVNGAQAIGNTTITGFANIVGNFQVSGTVVFANTLSANGGVGAAGEVLTSGGAAANVYWAASGGPGSTTNSYGHTVISGQANLVALTGNSALTVVAGTGITLTTNVASDGALHIASTAAAGFTLYDAGSSGTTKTIDWVNGPAQYLLMTGNCTITLSTPVDGGRYVLTANSGAGGFSITWPAAVLWPDNRAPVQTQTGNRIDIYTFLYVSALSNYIGSYNQNYG